MTNMISRPTILITGAALRLGKATAELFFQRGCNIMLHYNQSIDAAKALKQSFNQIRENSCAMIQADLTDNLACEQLISQTVCHFGRLDHLINNASIFYPTPFVDSNDSNNCSDKLSQQFEQFAQVNFKSPIKLCQLASDTLAKHKGSIVNLMDIYADAGHDQHTAYVAAKSALQGATYQLAQKLAPSVRVNGVSPGAILWPEDETSDQTSQKKILQGSALKRLGSAEGIAATIVYLALDASYTTGSIIKVDGGRRWYI
jgi:pteridine reductase